MLGENGRRSRVSLAAAGRSALVNVISWRALQFGLILAALVLGQLEERHVEDGIGAHRGFTQELGDGGDGGFAVVGLHDGVEHFVAAL